RSPRRTEWVHSFSRRPVAALSALYRERRSRGASETRNVRDEYEPAAPRRGRARRARVPDIVAYTVLSQEYKPLLPKHLRRRERMASSTNRPHKRATSMDVASMRRTAVSSCSAEFSLQGAPCYAVSKAL